MESHAPGAGARLRMQPRATGACKSHSQYPQKLAKKNTGERALKKKKKETRGPWLCRAGQKASLKPTVPSSAADKAHFPFITLYHKHKSTGKRSLEVVKPVPGFLFLGERLSDDIYSFW